MTLAAKENSVDAQNLPQYQSGKLAERKASANAGAPRVALAAKSLNTDHQQSMNEYDKFSSNDRKRAASRGVTFTSDNNKVDDRKRAKIYSTADDDEPTDDDDSQESDTSNSANPKSLTHLRNSTPTSAARSNLGRIRNLSRFHRQSESADDTNTQYDFALPTDLSPIPDEDLLEGYEPRLPLFAPPKYIPSFLRAVEDSMDLDFRSLPELEISEPDSDDGDVSYLGLRAPN